MSSATSSATSLADQGASDGQLDDVRNHVDWPVVGPCSTTWTNAFRIYADLVGVVGAAPTDCHSTVMCR
jgi:hypothetical protein